MSAIIQHLRGVNRKERYFLVGLALGNQEFRLSDTFRCKLGKLLTLDIPANAFAAMDYHLDWIYASLFLAAKKPASSPYPRTGEITATQQDVDFLIAFEDDKGCHLIMLEAKGVGGYTNKQMSSKACRLKAIFSSEEARKLKMCPYFAVLSPKKPARLKMSRWPEWMHPKNELPWLRLKLPPNLKKVVRCNTDENRIRKVVTGRYLRKNSSEAIANDDLVRCRQSSSGVWKE